MSEHEITEEPPIGSVVAIDWGGYRQEVWVANRSNVGNWYTPDLSISTHPTWYDVLRRAEGRTLTLLVAGDIDTYRAGYRAGVDAVRHAVESAIEDTRYDTPDMPEDGADD